MLLRVVCAGVRGAFAVGIALLRCMGMGEQRPKETLGHPSRDYQFIPRGLSRLGRFIVGRGCGWWTEVCALFCCCFWRFCASAFGEARGAGAAVGSCEVGTLPAICSSPVHE